MTADRKPLPDLAKGIAVLAMIQVHLMEVFARPELFQSLSGKMSLFIGGPFAAPVFLFIMGYFLAASKRATLSLVRRGTGLVLLGFLLNAGLNLHLLIRIIAGEIGAEPWRYILGADILINAGLSIILVSLLSPTVGKNPYVYLILAFALASLPLIIPFQGTATTRVRYLASFFIGITPWSYFPLVPWMGYSLAGYAWRLMEDSQWIGNVSRKPYRLYIAGVVLLLVLVFSPFAWDRITRLDSYYHHDLPLFLWNLGFLITWFILLDETFPLWSRSRFNAYLKWTGRNVTAVYIVQWLVIGNVGTAVYHSQFLLPLVFWFTAITLFTSWVVYLRNKIVR